MPACPLRTLGRALYFGGMQTHTYTDDDGRHWQVTCESSAVDGQAAGRMIFRSGQNERTVRCRDSVWLAIAEGELQGMRLEDTLEAHFREAR